VLHTTLPLAIFTLINLSNKISQRQALMDRGWVLEQSLLALQACKKSAYYIVHYIAATIFFIKNKKAIKFYKK